MTSGSAYPELVEILLWLVPPALATLSAMVWVSWLAREGRGEVDRDVAIDRLARALEKDHRTTLPERAARVTDRSSGIAVRPTRAGPRAESDTRRAS